MTYFLKINSDSFLNSPGMACFMIVFIMSMEIYDLSDVADILKWIFMFFPHFALSHALSNINTVTQLDEICTLRCNSSPLCTPKLMCFLFPTCCGEFYFLIYLVFVLPFYFYFRYELLFMGRTWNRTKSNFFVCSWYCSICYPYAY